MRVSAWKGGHHPHEMAAQQTDNPPTTTNTQTPIFSFHGKTKPTEDRCAFASLHPLPVSSTSFQPTRHDSMRHQETLHHQTHCETSPPITGRPACPTQPVTNSQERNRSEERRVGKECRSRWSPY